MKSVAVMNFDPSKLKKVELHVHLDTCLSYHYVKKIDPQLTLSLIHI